MVSGSHPMETNMRRQCVVAVLLSIAMPLLGQTSVRQAKQTSIHRVEGQVRQASESEDQALLARALDARWLMRADDFVVTNPLNRFVTKQQVMALIEEGTLVFQSYERRIEY